MERWKYLKTPKRESEEMGNPTDPTDQGKMIIDKESTGKIRWN